MSARAQTYWAGLAGLFALVLVVFAPGGAWAQCCAPPPCCAPPRPPAPREPCCGSGSHEIKVPGVNVSVGASVVVNASTAATVHATSAANSGAFVVYGGGGSSYSVGNGPVSVIQGLNVEGPRMQRTAYNATRTRIKTVVIQAFCLDDRAIPHPASQVTPDREIAPFYDGELYRCLAGTRMQITFADYDGKISFEHGQTMMCAKGEALYYARASRSVVGPDGGPVSAGPGGPDAIGPDGQRAGRMECRPQKAARDCNERSLLRRFGAGVKILRIITTETYTAYREEQTQSSQMSSFSMTVDGGVGGVSY